MSILDKIRHAKNREKEMARHAEQAKEAEAKRTSGTLVVKESLLSFKVHEQLETMVMEQIGISREVTQSNVRLACRQMLDIVSQQGNAKVKYAVMVNLPGEMRKVLQGRTSQEAFEFYWDLPEFREVWPKLGFTETHLKDFVNAQARVVKKDLL